MGKRDVTYVCKPWKGGCGNIWFLRVGFDPKKDEIPSRCVECGITWWPGDSKRGEEHDPELAIRGYGPHESLPEQGTLL